MKSSAPRKPLLIVLGILLVGAGIGLNIMLPRILGTDSGVAQPNGLRPTATVAVVVTTVPVTEGAKFDPATNVAVAAYPVSQVPPGAFASVDKISDQYAKIALPANTVLTPEMLVPDAKLAGGLTVKPIDIPAGDVLFPVDYDPKTMGYFLPGNHVDILAADANNNTSFPMTNLLIARLGNPAEQGAGLVPTTIELVVTRAQAVQIGNLISGAGGTRIVRWILRSPKDTG